MNTRCKKCSSDNYVKNGNVRGMQRYRCKECGCNFTNTQLRGRAPEMKALAVLLYSMGKSSFRWLGRLFGVAHTSVYKWIMLYAKKLPNPKVPENLQEIEIDEMWHFVDSKKTRYGFGKPIVGSSKKLLPGWLVNVTLTPLRNCGKL